MKRILFSLIMLISLTSCKKDNFSDFVKIGEDFLNVIWAGNEVKIDKFISNNVDWFYNDDCKNVNDISRIVKETQSELQNVGGLISDFTCVVESPANIDSTEWYSIYSCGKDAKDFFVLFFVYDNNHWALDDVGMVSDDEAKNDLIDTYSYLINVIINQVLSPDANEETLMSLKSEIKINEQIIEALFNTFSPSQQDQFLKLKNKLNTI